MTKKLFVITVLVTLAYSSFGQSKLKYIFFYKPYTDSVETDLYKDTTVKFDYKIQYENLKNAIINDDVGWAIKNNDFRVISISGYSYLFPGLEGGYIELKDGTKAFVHLDKKYEDHVKKYGFKVIQGTSDHINPDEVPLQSASYDYASEYNKRLFVVLEKKK